MKRFGTKIFWLLTIGVCTTGNLALWAKDSPALELARQLNDAFTEIADKASPVVVVITVDEKPDGSEDEVWSWFRDNHRKGRARRPQVTGQGSGIILSEDGYILTNDHVVENAEQIHVRLKDGRVFDHVELKGTDPESDVAVIKIPVKGLTPARLGDSDKTRVGEFVLAIGAPFDLTYSVTVGHVSAKGRSFEMDGQPSYSEQDFMQTDASINPGNSGGPLVNLYGEVIAINAMIEGMNTGIGFAIPINLAKRVSSQLISQGKYTRSIIGVGIDELGAYKEYLRSDNALLPDADEGVVIATIFSDSPAAKSKLKAGDVVVAVDSKAVKSPKDLKGEIAAKIPGQVVTLSVVRGKEHLAVKVKTEALHSEEMLAAASPHSENGLESAAYGLKVEALTRDLARQYGVEPGSGVIVSAVEENSPADDSRIKKGDVITEVNRKPVSSLRQFRDALKSTNPRSGIALNLISEGATRFVILKDDGR
jgi:serine protease Do